MAGYGRNIYFVRTRLKCPLYNTENDDSLLMGTLYRIGERVGVPTPTVRAVYWTVKAADGYAK